MSITRIYRCDICHLDTQPGRLVGIHFIGQEPGMLATAPSQCERHICQACIDGIKTFPPSAGEKHG